MSSTLHRFLLPALASALLMVGCRIPRVPVRQTVDYAGEFSVGGERVKRFRARDYSRLDTSNPILKLEYLPIDIFAVVDDRDSVKLYLVSSWQEYLWRFSEKLAPIDKQYYAPTPLAMNNLSGDTAVIVWGFPSYEGRDKDLRYVVRRRNNYWSIDRYDPGKDGEEIFSGVLQSFPQFTDYSPFTRFAPGGPYQRAMEDTTVVLKIMRRELANLLGMDEPDSLRP